MKQLLKNNPYLVLLTAIICFYAILFIGTSKHLNNTVRSDGDGYYAYLPALYLFQDPTFQSTKKVKEKLGLWQSDFIINSDKDGKSVNKYFAGVSLIYTPFFMVITGCLKLIGEEVNGYSFAYMIGILFASFILFSIGFIMYIRSINHIFHLKKNNHWIYIVVLFTSLWFTYSLHSVAFANNVLFFVVAVILWLSIQFKEHPTKLSYFYWYCFLIGAVAITRPTSLIVVLMTLFLFNSWEAFWSFAKQHILQVKTLVIGIVVMVLPVFFQLALWKWQTGHWFYWSYTGEGFNWTKSAISQVLFGYRNGILFHAPILLFCLLSAWWLYRKNYFHLIVYTLYFILITYITAAWWCHDFESPFGIRNFSEHYVFLLFPLFQLVKTYSTKIWLYIALTPIFILGFIRFNQFTFEIITNQRFTQNTYWKSLLTWSKEDTGRWEFNNSVHPFGKVVYHNQPIKNQSIRISTNDEFILGSSTPISMSKEDRIYVKATYTRSFLQTDKLPLLVINLQDSLNNSIQNYSVYPTYEDKQLTTESVTTATWAVDNREEYNQLSVYFWNKDKIEGELKNVTITIEKYNGKK